jgi:hypothetical protein
MSQKEYTSLGDKIDWLMTAVSEMKVNQERNRTALEEKIDKLKVEFVEQIELKVGSLRNEITTKLNTESARINDILETVQLLSGRVGSLESSQPMLQGAVGQAIDLNNGEQSTHMPVRFRPNNGEDYERSVMVSGINFDKDEVIIDKANSVIHELGEDIVQKVKVVNAIRYRRRFNGKPGFVKIILRNKEEKVLILRNKMKLKNSETHSEVYIKSCKSHAERLIESNTRALLRQLPQGHDFRVDANGRLRRNVRQSHENTSTPQIINN